MMQWGGGGDRGGVGAAGLVGVSGGNGESFRRRQ